jgi:hypothetical protein
MPYQAVVSMHGRLVTLNDYGALGYKNAVAIYSESGSLVRSYQLNEFIPAGDREKDRDVDVVEMVEQRRQVLFSGKSCTSLCRDAMGKSHGVSSRQEPMQI